MQTAAAAAAPPRILRRISPGKLALMRALGSEATRVRPTEAATGGTEVATGGTEAATGGTESATGGTEAAASWTQVRMRGEGRGGSAARRASWTRTATLSLTPQRRRARCQRWRRMGTVVPALPLLAAALH